MRNEGISVFEADILPDIASEEPSSSPVVMPQEGVTTTQSTEQQLLIHLERLWKENVKNRFELGKTLFELQELYALPGHGTFLEKVDAQGIKRPTAYRLIKHYKDEAGLSKTEKDDEGDNSSTDGSAAESPVRKKKTAEKVIVWLESEQQKINWGIALQLIARVQGLNEHQAAYYAVRETCERLSQVDAFPLEAAAPVSLVAATPVMQDVEEL